MCVELHHGMELYPWRMSCRGDHILLGYWWWFENLFECSDGIHILLAFRLFVPFRVCIRSQNALILAYVGVIGDCVMYL